MTVAVVFLGLFLALALCVAMWQLWARIDRIEDHTGTPVAPDWWDRAAARWQTRQQRLDYTGRHW